MKIAYIMLVHRQKDQIVRLVERLNDKNVDFYLHIDKNSGAEFTSELRDDLSRFPNVFVTKSTRCSWGDFSIVRATLNCINQAMMQKKNYDYFILLSGQDYPIKSTKEINDFLEVHKGNSFIEYTKFPYIHYWYEGGYARTKYWNFKLLRRTKINPSFSNRVISSLWLKVRKFLPDRKYLLRNFEQYGGSQWWCISGDAMSYIYEYLKNNKKYERFFFNVEIPDEIFFQTLLLNSPYKDRVINNHLRYMKWEGGASSPSILSEANFEEIKNTKALFARKFDIQTDREILNLIDNSHYTFNDSSYLHF